MFDVSVCDFTIIVFPSLTPVNLGASSYMYLLSISSFELKVGNLFPFVYSTVVGFDLTKK